MIIPPGYCHVQHFFAGSSLPNGAAVTYGTSGFGAGSLEAFAAELHLMFMDNFGGQLTSSVQLQETRVKAGPNSTGPFASFVNSTPGGNAAESVPPNVAVLVEKRTALGGRSGRGRFYLPGVRDSTIAGTGNIVPIDLADLQARATAFLTDLEATTLGMVLFHNASSDPTPVTQLTVDPVAATQRRRLR